MLPQRHSRVGGNPERRSSPGFPLRTQKLPQYRYWFPRSSVGTHSVADAPRFANRSTFPRWGDSSILTSMVDELPEHMKLFSATS